MDRFESMQIFAKVVELNSFARAADALGIQRSTVSIMVKKLEAHLQIRLLQRTTRRLDLTAEGKDYYHHCLRILAQLDETEDLLASAGNGLRGRLRVQMPAAVGRLIVLPRIGGFRERYPGLELAIGLNDRPVYRLEDDLDCTLQTGAPDDPDAIQRKVGELRWMTAASPDYLRQRGEPLTVGDLTQHVAIRWTTGAADHRAGFRFDVDGHPKEISMITALATSDVEACASCSANGAGLIQAPWFVLAPYLEAGTLVEVLPRCRPRAQSIVAVYPHRRHVTLKARMFVEWMAELFEACALMQEAESLEQ